MSGLLDAFELLAPRLGMTLIHSLWEGIVIAAILWLSLHMTTRTSATFRYAICCLALASFVAACAVTFIFNAPAKSAASNSQPIIASDISVPDIVISATPTSPRAQQARSNIHPMRIVVIAWAGGVFAIALWHIAGWLWLHRIDRGTKLDANQMLSDLKRRLGINRTVRLFENSSLDVPAVLGVIRPMILIPLGMINDLSPSQIEGILAHELAHIRRHDYLINLIQAAVEALLFYHPATWWISAQIRREREHCCDDIAASVADVRTYASALLALEERRMPPAFAIVAASGGSLADRVRRMLKLKRPKNVRSFRSIAAGVIALACLAIPIAVVGQTKPTSSATQSATPATGPADISESGITGDDFKPNEEYRITKKDLLVIKVEDSQSGGSAVQKVVRVNDPKGTIPLPYLGALKVVGLTVHEAEKAILETYKDAKLSVDQVTITVSEARGKIYFLSGAIDRPGVYALAPENDVRLFDAIARGGGKLPDAVDIHILRRLPDKKERVLTVPVERVQLHDPEFNIVIRYNDTVIVDRLHWLNVSVAKDSLIYHGNPIDLAGLRKKLDEMSPEQRSKTEMHCAAASGDMTVERFFAAQQDLRELVREFKLARFSQTGIDR